MYNTKLFADWLLTDKAINIQSLNKNISFNDINNILDEICSWQKDNFQLESIIENIIQKINIYLPDISLKFNQIYIFN